jgi:hypothetical protein
MANGLFNLKQVVQAVQQGGWPAQKPPLVEYLVVAGGGGGGSSNGGGGGAGGLLTGLDPVPNGQTLLVTVGAGGNGGSYISALPGYQGENSVFGSITATGGGGGGTENNSTPATSGGSGGGANYVHSSGTVFGQGISGQGNAGGKAIGNVAPYNAGGGGGAGTVGVFAKGPYSGTGGAGIASAISGTVTTYAGGGGGGCFSGSGGVAGAGGVGGGGTGSTGTATNGSPNTGGGGGGSGNSINSAGTGGSGIVIVSYPDVYAAPTATTGSPTVSTSGSGSISFTKASSQWISCPTSSNFNLGSNNFTVECWAYFLTSASQLALFGQINSAASYSSESVAFTTNASSQLAAEVAVGGTGYTLTSGTLSLGVWYHFALVRNSTVLTLYVNGTSVGTITVAGSINSPSTAFTVGRFGDFTSTYFMNGYISNLRLVNGTAVYTSNFTPSTAPLTPITNTVLLLNTVSGGAFTDVSSAGNQFTTSSTSAPTWNATSPFSVTGYKNRVYTWTSSGSITF